MPRTDCVFPRVSVAEGAASERVGVEDRDDGHALQFAS